ncbi:MAG: DNA/RNA non-specific endonuclease [Saprospiraceae bacterium]|nr:DNA/RNA non-specific endonuclease [Saprospiraceae bacterium]
MDTFFLKKYGHQYFETEEFAESDHPARTFLPSASGQVIHHTYYTLSYNEKNEQAQWVAYVMDRKMLNVPNLPRYNYFDPDYQVTTRSAFHRDYNSSGYTRGHLVPAGDMAFDTLAMRETFLMSNISPQLRAFNNGIWKELEENVRDWTYKAESLYIISGPIFTGYRKTIGRENKIAVPDAFFKVLLDYTDPERKAIAFILPHEMSERRLQEFMVSVDEVERVTGIDFFNEMINDVEEEKLESQFDKTKWNVSDKRYQLRITKWNYE